VFPNLPENWEEHHTFSVRHGIVVDDIVELSCVFEYIHTGFYTLKEAIQDEIDKMIEWIDNQEGNIAVLRLAGFWL
jgi:hypothetical protein